MNITTLSPIIHGSVENGIVIEKVRILIEDTLHFSRKNTMLMGGRVDGSCDRNHWPASRVHAKKHRISRCKPEARRSLDVFIFFENNPMCQMKCFNLTNKLLGTKDLEVIIQPNLPKSYQVSLKNLGNAGSIDIQKRQYMPILMFQNAPISWMSYH